MNGNQNEDENVELQMMALEAELQIITDECNALEKQLQSTEQVTMSDLNVQNSVSHTFNAHTDVQSLVRENQDLSMQLSSLQDELERKETQSQQKEQEYTQILSEAQDKSKEQLAYIMQLVLDISKLQDLADARAETISKLEAETAAKDVEIIALKDDLNHTKEELKQQQSIAEIQEQLKTFEERYRDLSLQWTRQKEELDQKDLEIKKLSQQSSQQALVDALQDELRETKLMILANKEVVLDYQERILQLSQQNNAQIQKINAMTVNQATLIDTTELLRAECARYEEKIKQLEEKPAASTHNEFLRDSQLGPQTLQTSTSPPPLDDSQTQFEAELRVSGLTTSKKQALMDQKNNLQNLQQIQTVLQNAFASISGISRLEKLQYTTDRVKAIKESLDELKYENKSQNNDQINSDTEIVASLQQRIDELQKLNAIQNERISQLQEQIQNQYDKFISEQEIRSNEPNEIQNHENSIKNVEMLDQSIQAEFQDNHVDQEFIKSIEAALSEVRQSLLEEQQRSVSLSLQVQDLDMVKQQLAYKTSELTQVQQNAEKTEHQLAKLVQLQQTTQKQLQELKSKEKQLRTKYSAAEKKQSVQLQTIASQYRDIQQLNGLLLNKDNEYRLLETEVRNLRGDVARLTALNEGMVGDGPGSPQGGAAGSALGVSGVGDDVTLLAQKYNRKLEMMLE